MKKGVAVELEPDWTRRVGVIARHIYDPILAQIGLLVASGHDVRMIGVDQGDTSEFVSLTSGGNVSKGAKIALGHSHESDVNDLDVILLYPSFEDHEEDLSRLGAVCFGRVVCCMTGNFEVRKNPPMWESLGDASVAEWCQSHMPDARVVSVHTQAHTAALEEEKESLETTIFMSGDDVGAIEEAQNLFSTIPRFLTRSCGSLRMSRYTENIIPIFFSINGINVVRSGLWKDQLTTCSP